MRTGGQIIKTKRETPGLLLRQVAAHVDTDQAILSKIERGERKPSKGNIIKLAEILDEDFAPQALKVAEKKIKYLKSTRNGKV
jgi:HTH-type transcriptional regulator, competence development regulator